MGELTLEDARNQYRSKNKKCEYCEFSTYIKEIDDEGWIPGDRLFTIDVLYCKVKECKPDDVCEYYQVK